MRLDIETLKLIAYEIIAEESKRINKKINFYPMTKKEYYKKYLFKEKTKNKKIFDILLKPSRSSGFNDPKGNAVIFIDKVDKIIPDTRKLFALILCSYHEARHTEQKLSSRYSYETFLTDIEIYLIGEKQLNYHHEHNKFSFEIDANRYSIKRTKEYLLENYPEVYNQVKKEIELLEKCYYKDYIEYDAVNIIEKIIDYIRHKLKINFADVVDSMEIISPVLRIFLYKDTTFVPISMMIKDEYFQKLDKRIIYTFLSTKQFLENINLDKLTEEELLLINEALEYTNNIYLNQSIYRPKNYNKTIKQKLKLQKNILKRISYKRKLKKEESNRIERIKNITNYLGKTKKLINKF